MFVGGSCRHGERSGGGSRRAGCRLRSGLLGALACFVVACSGGGGGKDGDGGGTFAPSAIEVADDGTIYFLEFDSPRIKRWSVTEDRFLTPIELTASARITPALAYSKAHDRLYVGHEGGTITRIDAPAGAAPIESGFIGGGDFSGSLIAAGDFLLANTHHPSRFPPHGLVSYDRTGNPVSNLEGFSAGLLAFHEGRGEVIGVGETVQRVELDPATGALRNHVVGRNWERATYRDGIVASPTGTDAVAFSGEVFDASLETIDLFPKAFTYATYLADGTLVTLRNPNRDDGDDEDPDPTTLLERWDTARRLIDAKRYEGWPVAVVVAVGEVVVLTTLPDHGAIFSSYDPGVDGDGDGVPLADDAFPLDRAASRDGDGDGAPDAWNPGQSAGNSTTGLELDAFPDSTACQSRSQALRADPSRCDIAAAIPGYHPTSVTVDDDGIIYVLSSRSRRIFRWSAIESRHLDPIPVGEGASLIVHSSAHGRLYVAYERGALSQIDLAGGADPPREHSLVRFPGTIHGIFEVGNFLVQMGGGGQKTLGVFDVSRTRVASDYGVDTAVGEYVASEHRLYHVHPLRLGGGSFLYETQIDPLTGAIGPTVQRLGGAQDVAPRASSDGTRIALDDGTVHDGDSFDLTDRLPLRFSDARWLADDRLAVIGSGGDRRLVLLDADLRPIDTAYLGGLPYALVEAAGRLIALSQPYGGTGPLRMIYERYVPGTDGDHDGVPFAVDAEPLDAGVSVDSDGDGFPDRWNDGYTGSAIGSFAPLDAFPDDATCWDRAQAAPGSPDRCNESLRVITGLPDAYELDVRGVVHLLKRDARRIFRYSLLEGRWIEPVWIPFGSGAMGYSPVHDRLFVGADFGVIEQADAQAPGRGFRFFKAVIGGVGSITASGANLVVATGSYAKTLQVVSIDGRTLSSAAEDILGATAPEIVPDTNRLLHVHDSSSPSRLHWFELDDETGQFGLADYDRFLSPLRPALPLRASQDGRWVSFGSGEVFDADTLEYDFDLPVTYTDAIWQGDGGILTLRDPGDGSSRVELWGADFALYATESFAGVPLRILSSAGRTAIVRNVAGQVQVSRFAPSNDTDADGVLNVQDAFPLDPAASVDGDGDGAPDGWNPGRGPGDSTQGLVIDAFPNDAACQLPEHARAGQPTVCDIALGIPPYAPAEIELSSSGIVHSFSPENRRIYRWSIGEQYHLQPIAIGRDASHFTLSETNGKLYLAYEDGRITSIDLETEPLVEVDFASVREFPPALEAVESRLFVVEREEFTTGLRHVLFDAAGHRMTDVSSIEQPSELTWIAANRTLYSLVGYGLYAKTIDPATGVFGASRSARSNLPALEIGRPVRVAKDGATIALGTGRLFDGTSLELRRVLPTTFVDGRWLPDGSLLTIRDGGGGQTILERWAVDGELLETRSRSGRPLAILESAAGVVLVTDVAGDPTYQTID